MSLLQSIQILSTKKPVRQLVRNQELLSLLSLRISSLLLIDQAIDDLRKRLIFVMNTSNLIQCTNLQISTCN